MNKSIIFLSYFCLGSLLSTGQNQNEWPVLKHYDHDHLLHIALPLGGIGTGTVSLGGRGELRDWEIMNKPGKNFSTMPAGNQTPFFAIYVKPRGEEPMTKALIGPVDDSEYMNSAGCPVNHHGMPRFSSASFDAAYPFGQVNLTDETLPVSVRIKGYNPFIPGDVDASSIPVAILRYEVSNLTNAAIEVAVCGTMRNFIGTDGSKVYKTWTGYDPYGAKKNINTFRETAHIRGIYMTSDGVDPNDQAWGTIALTTAEKEVSFRRSSIPNDWENAILNFWDDFSDDGILADREQPVDDNPMASLAVKKIIPPKSTQTFAFYITWHFPNRMDWNDGKNIVGNYYTTRYNDAWDVIEKEAPHMPEYENRTIRFVRTFLSSTIPDVVKEAALFNLSTLRSQTVFRLPSGHMMGWEGVMNEAGSCYGNCTHVWNYETATSFLFGELAKTMRDVEFTYGTKENGKMMNRVNLPLESNFSIDHVAAADGQMGTIMRFYRDWMLSGDHAFLQKYWPKVKASMSYAWIEHGWDGNQDGVEEGRQHNTMDVDYFGPNPQMQFWYFGALKATAVMARAMKDYAFADKCDKIFASGSHWVDEHLFNGEYYEHKITDPNTFEFLNINNPGVEIPKFQLGPGCLVDQLVGQYMAHVLELGYLADRNNIRTTYQTIMKYNYIPGFENRFNNMRSYVMGKESGLVMASWPKGRLEVPFPYFAESMTGFEYAAAVGMLYEGQIEDGLKCIQSIRERFDGKKRNPFNEPECGYHYSRAMASWSGVLALTGFHYSGINHTITFSSNPGVYFWSNGYAWGTCRVDKEKATLTILSGSIALSRFALTDGNSVKLKKSIILSAEGNDNLSIDIKNNKRITIH
ncbi:MAG: hypothetical protein LBR10_06090 [Prevotellaceae bacterium]|jgi:uncharacterized protein (DUF608 family)|nr:hypothetical protein [Prevotellaceae bacterium]